MFWIFFSFFYTISNIDVPNPSRPQLFISKALLVCLSLSSLCLKLFQVICTENVFLGKLIFWNIHHSLFSSLVLTFIGHLDLLVNICVSFLSYHGRFFMNFQKVYSLVSFQELLIPLEQTVCLQNWKAHFSKGYILPLSNLVYLVVL